MKYSRIKFFAGLQTRFIEEVYTRSSLSTKELAGIAGVHPRSFRDWKREKLTMTLAAAEVFCDKFGTALPEDKELMVGRWLNAQREAAKKGGRSRFMMYGSPGTLEGRRKGGQMAMEKLRKRGIVPLVKNYELPKDFNDNLAEFVGIMLGDGGMTYGQCTITLNSIKDIEYSQFIISLSHKLFGERPKIFMRKNENTMIIYYNGVSLVRYLVSIGLKTGNKLKQQVGVPEWVVNSKSYKIACLRGLMDTDGGVFLHKYTVKRKIYGYKKICFSNRSMPLLKFVKQTLEEIGYAPRLIDNVENKKVWLYNIQEVDRYLNEVGTHNHRLLHLYGG